MILYSIFSASEILSQVKIIPDSFFQLLCNPEPPCHSLFLPPPIPVPTRLAYHWSPIPNRPARKRFLKLYPDSFLESDAQPALNSVTSYTILTWPSINWLNAKLEDFKINALWFR